MWRPATALTGETYPLFKNDNGTFFRDVTYASGLGGASIRLSGWGNALADFDEQTTNGYAEGIINKVKVIKRCAYGPPRFAGFRARVRSTGCMSSWR